MVDDYDYEYKRRRPRRDTYEGSYRRPGQSEYFDPSADILAGIESVEKSIGERKKKVTDFENTAALENQKYQDALADTESMEDTGVVDSLQQNLSDKILELNRLKIASFEGDQTEYLKKSSELNRYIETLPVLMGLIDEEAKTTKDARLNGTFNKEYLKSNNKQYLDFIDAINDGGKGVTFDTKNGNIIAKLNGKEVFNGNAYIKGKKEGFDLINYADGYQEQIDQADVQAYKGLENLVRKDIIKGVEKGDKITGEIAKNYAEARQKYKERLLSGEIAIPINESTYQKYTKFGSEDPNILSLQWGEDIGTQSKLTKKAIIESMVENRFPGGDRVVVQTTEEAKKKPTAFEIREQQQKEMELRLKEQESKAKILGLTEPKFVNQFKKEYTQSQQVAFEAALRSYKEMNILLDQLQDPEFSNKEGIINEEGIARANNFFPGIKDLGMEKVNTRLKLKTVLNQEFLKGDGKTEGLSINVFRVMNKDYEELLEKQDKAKYPTVELASDLNDKEIGSIVKYDDILYTIVEVGGKKQLEEKK